MLLPSAIGCDSSSNNAPKTRGFQSALFASPPLSPPPSSSSSTHPAINNLYSTCRVLQSMLTTQTQLPSPPTQHAEMPVSYSGPRLRLRSRKPDDRSSSVPRKKIMRRSARNITPPRGANKRRRELDDEMSRDDIVDISSSDEDDQEEEQQQEEPTTPRPSTPKRMRIAPEIIPLGLERSDFHTLHLQKMEQETGEKIEESVEGNDEWSTEEDRMLVELILEKLKLTKSDWQDCARSLGKERGSVGKRWKSLMGGGEVGLKRNHLRRGKIHGTWR